MSYTLVAILILATVILIFSDDVAKLAKKIWKIKGVKLFFPLLLGTYVIFLFEETIFIFLAYLQYYLKYLIFTFTFSNDSLNYAVKFSLLLLLIMIPLATVWMVFKIIYNKKFSYASQLMLYLFIFFSFMLLIPFHY